MWVPALVLTATAIGLALAVGVALRRRSRGTVIATTAIGALILLGWIALGRDRPWMAALLPGDGVAVLAAWSLPLAALVVGSAWRILPGPWWRRGSLSALCLGAAAWDAFAPVLMPPPRTANDWRPGVCLQTTANTCSAAAAATLLLQHGVVRSEGDLAAACLTTDRGTSLLGLVGGLRRYAPDGATVHAAAVPVDEIGSLTLPAVVSVVLSPELHRRDPRFRDDWGWIVDQPHSVVLFAIDAKGRTLIGDPANGRELWPAGTLAALWNRRVVWIERDAQ